MYNVHEDQKNYISDTVLVECCNLIYTVEENSDLGSVAPSHQLQLCVSSITSGPSLFINQSQCSEYN